jgi:hypothetical protein
MTGVFEKFDSEAYPYWYSGELLVGTLAGGIPQDPRIVEAWIRSKVRDTRSEAEVIELVATTMAELGLTEDEAIEKASSTMVGMNGFKRDATGLYVEGRQLKAALKEAVMVAANAGKITSKGWGAPDNATFKKLVKGWFPEHVFVVEERLHIRRGGEPVEVHDGVTQKFVHTHRGDSISYEQFVNEAELSFTIKSDFPIKERDWAMIFLTGEMQGVGASRSQEYGRYRVTKWEAVPPVSPS